MLQRVALLNIKIHELRENTQNWGSFFLSPFNLQTWTCHEKIVNKITKSCLYSISRYYKIKRMFALYIKLTIVPEPYDVVLHDH